MTRRANQQDQLVQRRDAFCEVRMDADRIRLDFKNIYTTPLKQIADEIENMRLCAFIILEGHTLWLMYPDFGMFGCDEEFRIIISELCDEKNYELIYKD